jgi:hypothetical protein
MLKVFTPNDIISFGKYEGKRIQEIAEADPSYIKAMLERVYNFFITPEDMVNLSLWNSDFHLCDNELGIYLQKNKRFEQEFIMSLKHLPPEEWGTLKSTRKNARRFKEIRCSVFNYTYAKAFTLLYEASDFSSIYCCELAVNGYGEPIIKVFADITTSLEKREDSSAARMATQGLLGKTFPTLIRLEASMDHYSFGAVAYRLVEAGLLKLGMSKSLERNKK